MKLQVILNQRGDLITNLSEAHSIAKGAKAMMYLNLECGVSICINPESNLQDLITIALKENEIADLKNQLTK